ncbi:MAG TPA: hypothetical protein DDW85_01580 [Porphyromonadaceae bacterium]|nr:hypothetical protein [Porphyromonadaceae bacterium]
MNSPWGYRGGILERFGWTYEYLLWGISWLNVRIMLDDATRSVDDEENDESGKGNSGPVIHRDLKTKEDIMNYVNGVI